MNVEVLIPIALFAMIFGVVYISVSSKHRQRMAMIEKGMDPGGAEPGDGTFRNLRNGMLMMGVGLGLLFGYVMDINMPSAGVNGDMGDTPLPYFIMVLLCGGASLIGHHLIVRKKQAP
jgi:hypothetical protein